MALTSQRLAWGRDSGDPAKRWRLRRTAAGFSLTTGAGVLEFRGEDVSLLSVRRGWFRASLAVAGPSPQRLRGLDRASASVLQESLAQVLLRHRLLPLLAQAGDWRDRVQSVAATALDEGRWVCRETLDELRTARPDADVRPAPRRGSGAPPSAAE